MVSNLASNSDDPSLHRTDTAIPNFTAKPTTIIFFVKTIDKFLKALTIPKEKLKSIRVKKYFNSLKKGASCL